MPVLVTGKLLQAKGFRFTLQIESGRLGRKFGRMSGTPSSSKSDDDSEEPSLSALGYGSPKFDRRLSDKVLAAHNHAYAIGERDLADRLLELLKRTEDDERAAVARRNQSLAASRRQRQSSAVNQAALWRAYMDALDTYDTLVIQMKISTERLDAAKALVKRSLARWRLS